MTPQEIKSQLVLKGTSHTEIAQRAKVSRPLVTLVIQCKRKNHKVRQVIARAIGKPWQEVFTNNTQKAA